MITYQKVYTDHVHSSTLMSQFTQLWRNRLMCDADIVTGNTVIKAHRLVLVASCAILQSHDNVATGTVLEVTLPSDIPQKAVYMFLEFLYQGHMILSEENVEAIEKIARLLHAGDVLKCCYDFAKTIKSDTNRQQEKFSFHELVSVNHIRSTCFIKSVSIDTTQDDIRDDQYSGQRSSKMETALSQHSEHSSQVKTASSVSFKSSPSAVQKHRLNLSDHQTSSSSRTKTNSSTDFSDSRDNSSSHHAHGIIDLSDDSRLNSQSVSSNQSQVSSHRRNSDQTRSYSNDQHVGSNVSSKRRHSDQSRPNSTDTTPSANNQMVTWARSHDQYCRSLSEESLNQNNLPNVSLGSYPAPFGFAMPVIPSTLWSDKAMVQHFTSQQNIRSSSSNSISSSTSSKASTNHQGTRVSDFPDLPICIEQDDSDDNRLVLDVSEIDLSMIKTESIEEPLDLHVKRAFQLEEINRRTMVSESSMVKPDASSKPVQEKSSENQARQYPSTIPYSAAYQPSVNNDYSKQWSAQLQSAVVKKRPMSMSSNVRKIIQDLNLNRRALASPASLNSLAVGNHKPIRMPGKNNYKVCSLCYRNKIRTKSGYYVYSYYKCSVCDVPLCIGRRKCFLEYHKEAEVNKAKD
ncbi:Hypothetical predicted protein [Mytilus galloprovincialis]|uniref:BTB domain-containing protein n=1 Tax=Mytilus galloprovincialis TaxID=29158 RepID=A0A8B6CMV3_MYTGA|nr:Hypothetical predicted protein [Mytilus galloprovincialis]